MTKFFSHRALSLAAILLVSISASLLSGCAPVSQAELQDRDGGGD
jgi:hypothetical protein